MERRDFLSGGIGAAGALASLASVTAAAQNLPAINWRLASSFPKSLDTIYGGAEQFARILDAVTGGKFKISIIDNAAIVRVDVRSGTDTVLVDMLRMMIFGRYIDRKAISLQRRGKLGTFAPMSGQEAVVVASTAALERDRDWVVPQYREQLAGAREEASNIREEAKTQGAQILAEMRTKAQEEADRLIAQAKAQIEAERAQAVQQLRAGIARPAPVAAHAAVREMPVDLARMHRATLAHEGEDIGRATRRRRVPAPARFAPRSIQPCAAR